MDKSETDFLNTQEYLPLVRYRCTDDIFFNWTHIEEKLKFFLDDLNNYHPNTNFTHESIKECINVLDLLVSFLDNKVSTDLHIKSTDRHQHLHYFSSHPDDTKKSSFYRQALSLNGICSVQSDFVRQKKEIKPWFLKRGYPESIINREMEKINFRKQVFSTRGGVTNGVSLSLTYHPLLKSVRTILYENLYLLSMDKEVKKFFPVAPKFSFKSAGKRSSYPIRAKVFPLQSTVG